MFYLALLLAPYLLAGGALAQDRVCNSSPALCSKAYNDITHMGAHDSPFVRNSSNGYSLFGDQFYDSFQQLDSGVRLLSGQIHKYEDDYHLCHTACQFLDAGLVKDWLSKLKDWLDAHPNDVVTILLVNSNDADAATLDGLWSAAGLVDYGYVPASTTAAQKTWPTLNELIDDGKRLVTYIASLDPGPNSVAPYLLDEFTFVFENPYSNDSPDAFDCDVDRPDSLRAQGPNAAIASGYLPLMNHFLYDTAGSIELPAVEHAQDTNADGGGKPGNMGAAADNCTDFYQGRKPTYILADFVNVGPALDVADRLNGVQGNVQGRTTLPNTVLGLASTASVSSRASSSSAVTSASTMRSASTTTTADASTSTAALLSTGGSGAVGPTGGQAEATPSPSTAAAVRGSGAADGGLAGLVIGMVGWFI